jgi:putative transposase
MRNALAHAGRSGRRVVAAFIVTAFARDHADAAKAQWRQVADQVRPKLPKLAVLLDEAEADVLAAMTFPKEHRAKLHSTNPLERLNGEIKRRTEVVGIFPNEAAITRLVGAILLEQNDEWAVQRARSITLATIAPLRDDLTSCCPPWRHEPERPDPPRRSRPPNSYTTSRDTTGLGSSCFSSTIQPLWPTHTL